MIVRCPECQTPYKVDPERLRRGHGRLRCARCKTVFPVILSPDPAPAPPPAAETPKPAAGASRPPGRLEVAVLAIETGALRQRLQSSLSSEGVRTIACEDGPTALDAVRRSRPRLLVVAHPLVGLTGPEVIARVREETTLHATRLVLVGGPAPHGRWTPHPATIHGADAWLPEDARDADILATIRALLGGDPAGLPPLDAATVRDRARVVVADLREYLGELMAEGRREGIMPPRVTAYLAAARADFLESQAGGRLRPQALRDWDEEIVKALREKHA